MGGGLESQGYNPPLINETNLFTFQHYDWTKIVTWHTVGRQCKSRVEQNNNLWGGGMWLCLKVWLHSCLYYFCLCFISAALQCMQLQFKCIMVMLCVTSHTWCREGASCSASLPFTIQLINLSSYIHALYPCAPGALITTMHTMTCFWSNAFFVFVYFCILLVSDEQENKYTWTALTVVLLYQH